MQSLIHALENQLITLPLPGFVLLGSFLEEIIAPIPASFIMVTAGFSAAQQEYSLLGIVILLILGAVGKTFASILLYTLGDKAEDWVVGKYGRYIGLSHEKVLELGSLLSKNWWDDVLLFFLRAVPIFPTFFVSIACGAIRVHKGTFVATTFFGTIVRNIGYLALGLYGVTSVAQVRTLVEENFLGFVGLIAGLFAVAAAAELGRRYAPSMLDRYRKAVQAAKERRAQRRKR